MNTMEYDPMVETNDAFDLMQFVDSLGTSNEAYSEVNEVIKGPE